MESVQSASRDNESGLSNSLHYTPFLEALSKDGITTVLVSAKSESPRGSWKVGYDVVEGLCSTVTGIESCPVSLSAPETHKRCISIILRNIMAKRRGELLPHSLRSFTYVCFDKTVA